MLAQKSSEKINSRSILDRQRIPSIQTNRQATIERVILVPSPHTTMVPILSFGKMTLALRRRKATSLRSVLTKTGIELANHSKSMFLTTVIKQKRL